MAGRHKFSELRTRMTPDAQERVAAKSASLENEMKLAEIRKAMQLSQEEIAAILQVSQGSVAKIEKRADMLVGTLGRFIRAMGGELELIARFPDASVRIDNFASLSTNPVEEERAREGNHRTAS